MKPILASIFLMLLLPKSFGQVKGPDITGVWLNDKENAHIEIYQKEGAFFGKIIWMKQPDTPDSAEKSKRFEELLGMDIISNLVFDGGIWEKGTLYLPKKDREVNCEAQLSDDKGVLTLNITKLWFSNSIKWTRIP
ncbi:DUF2147 domain-containing protein [Muricauda sp. 334s03]|uniref:DUF2147 domain-containing protein n=1 Tax=Flagellimonas yonaguniensis TaxID=3031325 RepID=A0ABT5XXQ9_9FLAO|nr:DUF2147 domain-containing protein [[Muricauda] yonaguniensis]MDF0715969.1 DUF2147 domain-containing protein [[Muricauda] yonaguniensis]